MKKALFVLAGSCAFLLGLAAPAFASAKAHVAAAYIPEWVLELIVPLVHR
jgi:hypothetical protein